jgi:hypothetical protein
MEITALETEPEDSDKSAIDKGKIANKYQQLKKISVHYAAKK